MNNTWIMLSVSGLLLGLLCGVTAPVPTRAAGQSNNDYTIDRDVVNAGGGRSQSSEYVNTGSLGQTSPPGSSSNVLHVMYAGFWHGKAFTLSIAKSGTGSGTVKDCETVGDCPGTRIDCGADCADFYNEGDSVLLQAFPESGSTFDGWFLDGVPLTALVYVTRDLTITAAFRQTCVMPSAPANLSPANGEGNQPLMPMLEWADSAGAASYTVSFGTTSPPPQVAANLTTLLYAPGTLTPNTTYYWRVDAVNTCGSQPGAEWSFQTTRTPVITSTPPALTTYIYAYDVEATDADGDTLTYSLSDAPDDMMIDEATGEIIWVPNPLDLGASYTTTVIVSDGNGGTASQSLPPLTIIESLFDEEPPVVTLTLDRGEIALGASVTMTLSATDNTGIASAQALVNGASVLTATGTTTYTPTTVGEYTLEASAQDAAGNIGFAFTSFWVRETTATIPQLF